MPTHTLAPFPAELLAAKKQIREMARSYGLDFYPTIFEMCDYEQMNQIAAYGGFPQRYPHWRFGAEYERLRKQHHYGLGRIYEMVINNDPCYAYLQESNALVDQKLVIAHVYGHCDFFKNNLWFGATNRKMMDEMANHSTRIRRHIEKHGQDEVERFLDVALSLEDLIDPHSMFLDRGPMDAPVRTPPPSVNRGGGEVSKFKAKDYMDRWINPQAVMDAERKKMAESAAKARHVTPARPSRDVLQYLIQHARLDDWQIDCLSIVREESYYFAPQGMTKVMNEGWACLESDALVLTDRGLLTIGSIARDRLRVRVSDGGARRKVLDFASFKNREVVRVRTARGLTIKGSTTHRVLVASETWKRLDELAVGDCVKVAGGQNLWARDLVEVSWSVSRRSTLHDVADRVGVCIETVLRHRAGKNTRKREEIEEALKSYDREMSSLSYMQNSRESIVVPRVVDERLAAVLGYLIGDGHISRSKRVLGLTTGDLPQAETFIGLLRALFGVSPRLKRDGGRYRVLVSSRTLEDFLVSLGLTTGISARKKAIPEVILRSPAPVVAAFLQAYFDCDGYAGKQGVILSTMSEALASVVQVLLLNFGVLSRRRVQSDACFHVHITGKSVEVFGRKVGFGLRRKQDALEKYLTDHSWFKNEAWEDRVVAIERSSADVFDISVEETHRYVAQGLINHNSFWHSTLMTRHFLEATEVIDYADHHSGTVHMPPGGFNPYKIGIELFRDIEDRWNKGKFGKEYEEADDLGGKRKWDKGLGLGREKIFEIRRVYNDVNFIDEFMTPEFIEKHKFYQYGKDPHTGALRILSRDPVRIKQTLLYRLTNLGRPFVYVVDGNYCNRGELYLAHKHNGMDIDVRFAQETLRSLWKVWQRPVHLQARVDDDMMLFSFNGEQLKQQAIHEDVPKPAHWVV